jgi:hypothetical protein
MPDYERILKQYPKAKLGSGTVGYSYDFGDYYIVKNFTGTGGWILGFKTSEGNKLHPYALEFDEAVRVAEEKLSV